MRDVSAAAALRNGQAGKSLLDEIEEAGRELVALAKQAKDAKELTVAVNAWQGRLRASELRGRATGELSSSGTQVNVMLGVRMDVAQERLQAYEAASLMPEEQVIARAGAVLRAACASGDLQAIEQVRELMRAMPRGLDTIRASSGLDTIREVEVVT